MDELEQGTFDLDAFVQGRGFPTDTVTVFTNADAAYALAPVNARLTEIAQDPKHNTKALKEEAASLETRAQELKDEILASALTFHLRGISPGHIKKIIADVNKRVDDEDDELQSEQAGEQATHEMFAPHIIKVVNAKGEVDQRKFTAERVAHLEGLLPPSEWNKLDDKIKELSFKTATFDQLTDAGFLPKS